MQQKEAQINCRDAARRSPALPPLPLHPRAARHSSAPEGRQESSPGQGPSRSERDGPPPWVKWKNGSPPSHPAWRDGRGERGRASSRARGQWQDAPDSARRRAEFLAPALFTPCVRADSLLVLKAVVGAARKSAPNDVILTLPDCSALTRLPHSGGCFWQTMNSIAWGAHRGDPNINDTTLRI